MNELLDRYGDLLHEVDSWFTGCADMYPDRIACSSGCSSCCRGLFDITLMDALFLKRGFDLMPDAVKTSLTSAAVARLSDLSQLVSEYAYPWLLNTIPEEIWPILMPEGDETPCLLLSDGLCLLYEYRPMTCRLHGIPTIDISGEELSDEWCSLNFNDTNPLGEDGFGLRYPFSQIFAQELLLFREITARLFGEAYNEVDTLIPAALILNTDRDTKSMRELLLLAKD